MFGRAKNFFREQKDRLGLRIKYRLGFAGIPPVATHLACFLVGTLLFEPDTRGKVPSEMLVPWSLQRVEGEIQIAREYQLVAKAESCVLSANAFRLFQPESKKIFLVVLKPKVLLDLGPRWMKEDVQLVRKDLVHLPICSRAKGSSAVFG